MAWSGDIASLKADNPDLADKIEFFIPTEGGMTFVDNAMIPIGAKNPSGAAAFMNYVYDPDDRRAALRGHQLRARRSRAPSTS